MASIKYFRVYQLNQILWNWPQINVVIGLGQNLPLAFLDQSTCISQDQQFFPIGKDQLNGKLIFWLKRKRLRLKMHSSLWFLCVKLWSDPLSRFHLWAAPGFAVSQVRSPSLPSGHGTHRSQLQTRGQMPVTHVLGRCLEVMGFGRTTEIWREESNNHSETQPSTQALPWVHKWRTSPLSSASLVSSSLRGNRACSRWLLIREAMSLLVPKEKYMPSRTKGILSWKGEKRVIVLWCKTSA